jgi:hypothetical protein
MGVVPQRDRRPRTIVDYTFSFVNAETAPLAPRESMQFGHALHRILRKIRFANPVHGPVYLLKVDIADGFYRVYVAPRDVPKLGVAFPHRSGEEPLVAFPLALPMGWTASPPCFSAFTETIVDVAKQRLASNTDPPPHRLDTAASTLPPPLSTPRTAFFEGVHPLPPSSPKGQPRSCWTASPKQLLKPPSPFLRRAGSSASSHPPPVPNRPSSFLPSARSLASSARAPRSDHPFLRRAAPTASSVHSARRSAPSFSRSVRSPASSAVPPPPCRTSPSPARRRRQQPLQYFDVFVDDALGAAQGSHSTGNSFLVLLKATRLSGSVLAGMG